MKRTGTNTYNKRRESHRNSTDTKHHERMTCTQREEPQLVNLHTIKANATTQKHTNQKAQKGQETRMAT